MKTHPEASSFTALHARLQGRTSPLTAAETGAFAREISALPGDPDVRIALLGNVTLDMLAPALKVTIATHGWHGAVEVAPFGQYRQYLDGQRSDRAAPDLIALFLSLDLLRPDAVADFAALDTEARQALRDDIQAEIDGWITRALAATDATLLIANFAPPPFPALGIADMMEDYGEAAFYRDLNAHLVRHARASPRIQILDFAAAVARVGSDRGLDRRLFHLAKTNWSAPLVAEIADGVARHLVAAKGTARKCLVVDLDNSLWGGVLGEDGPWGIRIGPGDALGEAYASFQQRIRSLKARGILLAYCTKNNPDEVDALFAERTDMPLSRQDFTACSAGWGDKAAGLAAIAKALDIGIDALVFIDDNPAEIAAAKALLPQVESVLLPPDPASFADTLDRLPFFEKAAVLDDDRQKSRQYAQAAARVALRARSDDPADYLKSLGIVLTVRAARETDLPRLHQLFAKTNQFNVTTRRYTLAELGQLIASDVHRVEVASMRDAFGDLGLIAVSIVETIGSSLRIDSLVMSCRAMGRGAETAMLNRIKRALAETGATAVLHAEYRPTARNAPVETLFETQGFAVESRIEGGPTLYRLTASQAQPLPCDWITIEGES